MNELSHSFLELPKSWPVIKSVPKGPTISINSINLSITVDWSPIIIKSFAFLMASGSSLFMLMSLLKVPDASFETVFK